MRRSVWILILAAPIVLAAAQLVRDSWGFTASAAEAPTSSPEVKIDNFSFGPAALTVAAGTTVAWTNRDDIPHTAVRCHKGFKIKGLDTDDKVSFTVPKTRTY